MVRISKPAQDDLHQIFEYIARDSHYYTREVIKSILEKISQLEEFPESSRIVPELHDENIRELLQYSYRIIYRIKGDIEIAAVIHAKMDFNSLSKN